MRTKFTPFVVTALVGFSSAALLLANAIEPMMKAAVLHEHGGPEVLKYEDTLRPEPKDDEVLVKVMAAGVNPVDTYIRQGMRSKTASSDRAMIIGYDIAGVAEKVGAQVKSYKGGDAVYAYLPISRGGGYAEFAIAKEGEMSLKPKNIDFEKAAAVPLAATTAWQALIESAKVEKGQTVLIHGGSGGVGSFAIQIAKARGAKVIATASTTNQDLLKQLGADVSIDYTKQRFEDIAKDVDVVLDSVGEDTLARSYGVVKRGGFIVSLVARPDQAELQKRGIRGTGIASHADADDLSEIAQLIDAGKIKPMVTEVLPLTD